MRWLLPSAVACVVLSACGILSGLDSLTVDGGTDGSLDVTSDAVGDAQSTDATKDAVGADVISPPGDAGDASLCMYFAGNQHCFGVTCGAIGSTCCVAEAGVGCVPSCSGISLACTAPEQCTDAAPNCCLSNAALTAPASCPYVVTTNSNTATACTAEMCNAVTSGRTRVCATSADCPSGLRCDKAVFDIDPKPVLGLCL